MNNANYYEKVSVLEALKKGGLDIKLSALLMGFANLANKQIIKGLLFLLAEILFLITFVLQVIPSDTGDSKGRGSCGSRNRNYHHGFRGQFLPFLALWAGCPYLLCCLCLCLLV